MTCRYCYQYNLCIYQKETNKLKIHPTYKYHFAQKYSPMRKEAFIHEKKLRILRGGDFYFYW